MANYTTENLVPVLNPENGIPAIRIGDQVFTMVAGGGGGGATDFFKCASLSHGYLTVTGAGNSSVNGIYEEYNNSDPEITDVYRNENNYYLYKVVGSSLWYIAYTLEAQHGEYMSYDFINWVPDPEGTASLPGPIVTLVNDHTWTGYKAVFSGGVYRYESAVTTGLKYGSGFTPEVGKVYSDGALIQANLYEGE